MIDRPPASSRNRLPWLIAAACAALLVATIVFAVVALSGGGDSANTTSKTTTYQPGGPFRADSGKYKPGQFANACDALDLSAIEKMGFPAQGKPVHEEVNAGNTGRLECSADFENASLTGQVSYEVQDDPEIFDELKTSTLNTPPEKTTAGAISGLGSSAYFTVRDTSGGTRTYLTAVVEVFDANLRLRTTFEVSGGGLHTTREDVRKAAEAQARIMLDRLR